MKKCCWVITFRTFPILPYAHDEMLDSQIYSMDRYQTNIQLKIEENINTGISMNFDIIKIYISIIFQNHYTCSLY